MCLGRDLAWRNLLHWGQCTLVTVCWAEPGLPVSGRHMYELWDLRVIEQVEEEWEVKVEEALEVVEVEEETEVEEEERRGNEWLPSEVNSVMSRSAICSISTSR